MKTVSFEISEANSNIVTVLVLEELFDNLDNIPVEQLQEFVNKFKKQ